MRTGWVAEDVHDLAHERSFFAHVEEDGALVDQLVRAAQVEEALRWAGDRAERVFVRLGLDETTYVAGASPDAAADGTPPWPPRRADLERIAAEVRDFKQRRRQEPPPPTG